MLCLIDVLIGELKSVVWLFLWVGYIGDVCEFCIDVLFIVIVERGGECVVVYVVRLCVGLVW